MLPRPFPLQPITDFSFSPAWLGGAAYRRCVTMQQYQKHKYTTVLRPFLQDYMGEPVAEESFFWTLWCKGILNRGKHTDHLAGRHSIRTNQCPHLPSPHFLQARCPSCHPANSVKALKARHQNCQKNVLVGIKAPKETFCWQFTWKERSGSVWC